MVFSSTIYSNESDFEKQTNVIVKGKLYKNLFSKDEFIGEMTTDDNLTFEIILKEFEGRYFGLITNENNNGYLNTIGSINVSRSLDKVWIQLNEINERYNLLEGYISGPANNRIEAIEIARKILKGN